ncbi:hypothetical protein [Psychromonas aquimarina]|uniref:tetratricopeptide repeat-containing glycosyltransferase family protein n=1 Tax=Psychromonas aquimarina TaxID=444919 RepID=UPI00040CEB25|nr:hypothetical protein [Psychromonas aquimarina]
MTPKRIQKKIQQAAELNKKKQYGKAKSLCQEIVNKHQDIAIAWKLLATNACCLEQWPEAINAIKKAINLGDNELTTFRFLATCYLESQQYLLAEQLLSELFNKTKDSGLLVDLSLNLQRMGELKQAKQIYNNLLSLDPNNAKLRLNTAILMLTEQPYGEEWHNYSYRHFLPGASRIPENVAPIWRGEPLQGKNILIWQEQGIADQIIFTRTFPLVAENAKNVTVVGEPRLTSLLQSSFPEVKFVEMRNRDFSKFVDQQFDYQILAGDLPKYYLSNAQSLASSYRKLSSPKTLSKDLQAQLPSSLKVGISWFGGSADAKTVNRWSLPIEALTALIAETGANYFSLQYGSYKSQLKELSKQGLQISELKGYSAGGNFADYAALIENMDIIVAVDNSAAVLAAALGKEVWVLHPADPFWVWGINADQKWYPDTRHFVKPWNVDWQSFIENEVQPALSARLTELERNGPQKSDTTLSD